MNDMVKVEEMVGQDKKEEEGHQMHKNRIERKDDIANACLTNLDPKEEKNKKVKICLSMIVKNEEKIIERFLETVAPFIDQYCICDTGSTDHTKERIQSFFEQYQQKKGKLIEGKIIEEPFVNFEYNRNFVLKESKKMDPTHILVLDADMKLKIGTEIEDFLDLKIHDYDIFYILQGSPSFFYKNVRLFKNHPDIHYIGVTHEYISFPNHMSSYNIEKDILFIDDIGDGGSKSSKFERDIALLSKEVEKNPKDVRSWFYLGNSYKNVKKFKEAIRCFETRIEIGGWKEEIWYSWYQLGDMYENIKEPEKAIHSYLEAYQACPERFENIYKIIKYYREKSKHSLCLFFYEQVKNILRKKNKNEEYNHLFFEKDVLDYKLDLEYTIFAYYLGIRDITQSVYHIFSNCSEYEVLQHVYRNMKFYDHYLKPQQQLFLTKKGIKQWKQLLFQNCTSSSMSIIDFDQDRYLMNMRIVNYYITKNGNYEMEYDKVVTWNDVYFINKNTFTVESMSNLIEPSIPFEGQINGLEDVRVFRSVEDGSIYYLATMCEENGHIQIFRGYYNWKKKTIEPPFRLEWEPKKENKCEKNWVYCPLRGKDCIIYQWYPLQILRFASHPKNENDDEPTEPSKVCKKWKMCNKWKMELECEITMPLFFRYARGSSNAFSFQDELWFVIHFVHYAQPRDYYHCLVVFEKDTFRLLRHTSLSKLSHTSCIEYCLGIIVNEKEVILCISEMDRTSILTKYDKQYIEKKMIFVS